MNYQFIMEFLFKVMKKTWLLPPDLTEAKNTCRKESRRRNGRHYIGSYSHKGAKCYNLLACVIVYIQFLFVISYCYYTLAKTKKMVT